MIRPARALSIAAVAAGLTMTTLFAASSANAAGVNYVALGDSYSSGVGAGSYLSDSGSCKRSTNAYAYLWKNAHAPSSFKFVACSGAKTGDILNSQISALDAGTTLVSISVGGNDAGFADTMQTCVLGSESDCVNAVNTAKNYATTALPGQLDKVYSAIKSKSPNAHVVVMGYPHIYKIGGSCIFGIGDTARAAINSAADTLDGVLAKRAANAGFAFGDVRNVFTEHEICGSLTTWLNSATLPVDESYHPKAAGQSGGYLPVFSAS
ncbi:SGNH/GDSL hydrolase family protein [Kitasatospora xanthocidica]|uniref:SGNH/GDSL hydrolase family protein n=1 Tax=Kitasatospora xanthocidica TaxID=83382 RepID=A0A372ZKD8_9ACTN|nr:SGNH/GDSL hydrolase family protein [Kitasatospora xanthocidica]RGD56318.1 SGNH/GDSL hydrolase family protein [Kitasatospora xanthocidica]